MIRKLERHEYNDAISLALHVYMKCGTEDYNEEGLITFKSFIYNEQIINELSMYGAFVADRIIGIIGFKPEKNHISLFFILPEYHRKGIGKKLFTYMANEHPVSCMTVNSSTYAVSFYKNLGFEQADAIQCNHGITSVPMKKYDFPQ